MLVMGGCYGLTQMMPEEERKKAEADQKKMGIVRRFCDRALTHAEARACAAARRIPATIARLLTAPPSSLSSLSSQDPNNPLSLLQAAFRGGPPEEPQRARPAAAGAASARRAVAR